HHVRAPASFPTRRSSDLWRMSEQAAPTSAPKLEIDKQRVFQAWVPWVLLSALVFVWGVPLFKSSLDKLSARSFQVPALHNVVQRAPPIAPEPTADNPARTEEAVYRLNWLSAT